MTDEQMQRAKYVQLFQRLVSAEWIQKQYLTLPPLPSDHFWMHVTDLPYQDARKFLKWVFAEQLIDCVVNIEYTPQGNWLDHFPPNVYCVTEKGKALLAEPRAYVMQD